MSLDDNKLLIRNYYEKVVNTGNVNEIEKYIALPTMRSIKDKGAYYRC